MGEMLLNGRLYGANGVMELTQSQYDALPQSKLTDGVLYCIKDTGFVVGEQFAPVIYSLAEREVGTWTDGKPLYERMLSYKLTQNTGSMEAFYPFPSNMLNVDTAFVYHGIGLVNVPRPYSTTAYSIGVFCGESNGVKGVKVETGIDRSSYTITFVVRYTKTTDVAGSGTYGTDGARMVHYSNDEHIIGTWTDGKTLYEKTVHINSLPSAAFTLTNYAHNIANIDQIATYDATIRWSSGLVAKGTRLSLETASNPQNNMNYSIQIEVNKTNVRIMNGANRSDLSADVTIRYTKTV